MQPFNKNALAAFMSVYNRALAELGLPTLTAEQESALSGLLNLLAQSGSGNPLRDVLAITESRRPDKAEQLGQLLGIATSTDNRLKQH